VKISARGTAEALGARDRLFQTAPAPPRGSNFKVACPCFAMVFARTRSRLRVSDVPLLPVSVLPLAAVKVGLSPALGSRLPALPESRGDVNVAGLRRGRPGARKNLLAGFAADRVNAPALPCYREPPAISCGEYTGGSGPGGLWAGPSWPQGENSTPSPRRLRTGVIWAGRDARDRGLRDLSAWQLKPERAGH
jgi:hypothetical protein